MIIFSSPNSFMLIFRDVSSLTISCKQNKQQKLLEIFGTYVQRPYILMATAFTYSHLQRATSALRIRQQVTIVISLARNFAELFLRLNGGWHKIITEHLLRRRRDQEEKNTRHVHTSSRAVFSVTDWDFKFWLTAFCSESESCRNCSCEICAFTF